MLSICIGIYNWDVNLLVRELHRQAVEEAIDFEILLIDDASTFYKDINSQLTELSHVTYIENKKNLGRSAIRNLLVEKSKFPYLLFMDCDTEVISNQYIKNYCRELSQHAVISGGYAYSPEPPPYFYRLRWHYGRKVEVKSASERNKNPNFSFSTFNFVIKRSIFDHLHFDETVQGYGHEDTLFGWALQQQGFTVYHVENPLLHKVEIKTSQFIKQTEQAIRNLVSIYQNIEKKEEWIKSISLLKFVVKIKKLQLATPFRLFFWITKPFFKFFLQFCYPSLLLFNFYKAGYLIQHIKKNKICLR
ncbi:MAG TPA: glycosyltransferase [Bacteroidales bacterium]|nr:glycosyltransferase [Bacteroidales bacterium]HOS57524.1 glycosyltransferase [Bacteroidales bacterium]HXK73766.1 glycosyltransferase [Bacteroidales bacterium]